MAFLDYFDDSVTEGTDLLVHSIKSLVYKTRPDLFEKIDYNNNLAYLEPFVFAFFNSSHPTSNLDQLLYGYMNEDDRPKQIEAFTDDKGQVFIPELGFFPCELPNQHVIIENISKDTFNVLCNVEILNVSPIEIEYIPRSEIELFAFDHPYFKDYFFEWDNLVNNFSKEKARYEIHQTSHENKANLKVGFDLLLQSCPDYCQLIKDTNKRIVLFDNLKIRNFAVRNMHGMAFIGASKEFTAIYYLEEIIHQCGHNLFNAATANLSDFFLIDPETRLGVYSKNPHEYRSIYSTLHGLFTIAARIDCFNNTLELDLNECVRHELLGRLADLKRRFRTGLEFVIADEVYTSKGKELYQWMEEYCVEKFQRIDPLVEYFDYSNQSGPDFNYQEFAQLNPIRKMPEYV